MGGSQGGPALSERGAMGPCLPSKEETGSLSAPQGTSNAPSIHQPELLTHPHNLPGSALREKMLPLCLSSGLL